MTYSSSRTLVCSIVFLDIVEYSKKPVAEQMQLKQQFNGILAAALKPIELRDRVVLDTGDGAAITFLGDPEDALFVGMSIREAVAAASTPAVRMGINLGPVRLVRDLNAQVNIIGDGINVAQRVMSFSNPGQLLVSRSFYEVVSCLSRDYENLFDYVGARTDKHVREHEVYTVGPGKPPERNVVRSRAQAGGRFAAAITAPGPFGLQRLTFVVAPLVFVSIVGAAAHVQQQREAQHASEREQAAAITPKPAPTGQKPAAAPTRNEPVASVRAGPAAKPAPAAKSERPAGATAPAQIQLQVAPWGEVFVDGRSRGVSPPMRTVEVSPGVHNIEIRNANFPPHVARIDLRPGQEVRIRHRFR